MLASRLARSAVSRFLQRFQAPGVIYKEADQEDEFEQIFRLNHDTFAGELPQHAPRSDGRLIDKFHHRNRYVIAKVGDEVVGMSCITFPGEEGFSIEEKMTHPEKLDGIRDRALELRLLIIKKPYRKFALYLGMAERCSEICLSVPYCDYALLSAVKGRETIYARYGFKPIDVPKRIGELEFLPMAMSRSHFASADPLELRG